MKAISLRQPWAQMVLDGIKTLETRKWGTEYRGDLLICASKKIDLALPSSTKRIHAAQGYKLPDVLPVGVAICVVSLVDCRKMRRIDDVRACIAKYPRAKAWNIINVRPVRQVEIVGTLSLYDVPDGLIEFI